MLSYVRLHAKFLLNKIGLCRQTIKSAKHEISRKSIRWS